jgi:threonyl-tRNA synthetase
MTDVKELEDEAADLVVPERGSADELLDASAGDPLDPMRHSAAHVMAEAVLDLFPGTKLGIGPAIEGGFYYDFQLPRALTPKDLETIEARMAESVKADHKFARRELPPDEGRAFFEQGDQPFKVEILDDLAAKAKRDGEPMPPVSLYEHGPFVDLCRGPPSAVNSARPRLIASDPSASSARTVWPMNSGLPRVRS